MRVTRVSQYIKAPREILYWALIDPSAIAISKVPTGMTCRVHTFDARVGVHSGFLSRTTRRPESVRRPAHTDTYSGRFVELVPNERVVEIDEFETQNPALRGEMKITDKEGGTEVVGVHEGLPASVSAADNEVGWRMALGKLASFLATA